MKIFAVRFFLMVALGAIFAAVSGCETTEPKNASIRPWNSPQSWESGLPVNMSQQHE